MNELQLQPGLREFAHANLPRGFNIWEPMALENAQPIEHCVTARGEPICTCGRYLLVWLYDHCESGPP